MKKLLAALGLSQVQILVFMRGALLAVLAAVSGGVGSIVYGWIDTPSSFPHVGVGVLAALWKAGAAAVVGYVWYKISGRSTVDQAKTTIDAHKEDQATK